MYTDFQNYAIYDSFYSLRLISSNKICYETEFKK